MTQQGLLEGLPGGSRPLMESDSPDLEALLKYTACNATQFVEHLTGRRSHKVGPTFEALVHWALTKGDGYECLAWDLPIRGDGRTLGALDLVLRHPNGNIEHWELAYKLYLQAHEVSEWSGWVGPNERDRLSIKVSRLLDHQLPLSSRTETRKLLASLGVEAIDTKRILLLGTLFKHYRSSNSKALQASVPSQGCWAHARECWDVANRFPDARWSRRPKPYWFGPWHALTPSVSSTELAEGLRQDGVLRPQLWTCSEGGGSPFFFVNDQWGNPA